MPVGYYLAGRIWIALAFILAMIVFMPLFVFLLKLIRRGMQVYVQEVVEAFGKNEQVVKVVWALVIAMAGLVITKVLDPGKAQEVVGVLMTGRCRDVSRFHLKLQGNLYDEPFHLLNYLHPNNF
ncbi:MAG: hypothetical protein WC295_01155 [Methanoregula sp.]